MQKRPARTYVARTAAPLRLCASSSSIINPRKKFSIAHGETGRKKVGAGKILPVDIFPGNAVSLQISRRYDFSCGRRSTPFSRLLQSLSYRARFYLLSRRPREIQDFHARISHVRSVQSVVLTGSAEGGGAEEKERAASARKAECRRIRETTSQSRDLGPRRRGCVLAPSLTGDRANRDWKP